MNLSYFTLFTAKQKLYETNWRAGGRAKGYLGITELKY